VLFGSLPLCDSLDVLEGLPFGSALVALDGFGSLPIGTALNDHCGSTLG